MRVNVCLARKMSNRLTAENSHRIRKVPKVINRRLTPVARLCVGFVLALAAAGAGADELNMTPGVTEISRSIFDLHMYIFWICVVIGVVVFGAMFWSLIHHRKSQGVTPAKFHESTRLEIAWMLAIAPAVTAAWRVNGLVTPGPSLRRDVARATSASAT